MHSKNRKIVMTALMMSLVCVATMLIKIPLPFKGYLNLGDCIVLIVGWTLPCGYGFLAAGVGSALADLFSGYVVYAPATFIIKGAMSLIAFACFKLMKNNIGKLGAQLVGAILAEIVMVAGYFVFEGFLYGFIPSLVNIPANAVQGVAGLIIGIMLIKIFKGTKMLKIE